MITLLNQKQRRDMDTRCLCSSNLVSLLRRAEGLDLLDVNESTVIDTVQHPVTGKLIAVERDLIYPVAGYPPSRAHRGHKEVQYADAYGASKKKAREVYAAASAGSLHSTDSKSFKSGVPAGSVAMLSATTSKIVGKAKNYFKRLMGG